MLYVCEFRSKRVNIVTGELQKKSSLLNNIFLLAGHKVDFISPFGAKTSIF